ncbi:zinc finger CCCH domain-containing protein 14 [Aplochiton taeniatus]
MEIGAEISKKIRAAIKGKLQELGAYVDEELPDYIMVMVANKKTSQQMAGDLSLFLGNNTIKFTVWLHGVLEKLRSVAVEPPSLRPQLRSEDDVLPGKSSATLCEQRKGGDSKGLAVSSSRSETRVSSSANEHQRASFDKSSSRLTSTVRPLVEEAVIDIKPEMDDDLIAEDSVEVPTSRVRSSGSRETAQVYRPPQGRSSGRSTGSYRSSEGTSHSRQQHSYPQDSRGSRAPRNGSSKQEEAMRKRKVPVASSVVRVKRPVDEAPDSDDVEEEEEDDEEDEGYEGKSMSSRVSLPAKHERKPSLPAAKQANRNLILKAISEAQDSITKTTAYPQLPQRQTVPVAPRTRMASQDMTAAIQLVQEHLHSLAPRVQTYTPSELQPARTLAPTRSLASRLQLDVPEDRVERTDYGGKGSNVGLTFDTGHRTAEGGEMKAFDTRSFIVSRPVPEEPVPVRSRLGLQSKEEGHPVSPRMVQASKERADTVGSASPKFIVTLDGVPSPLGNVGDCDMEAEDFKPSKVTEPMVHVNKESKLSILHRLQGGLNFSQEDGVEMDLGDEDYVPTKRLKVLERCKFWPVCKTGDECPYHHPTTQCKTFPSCKFGDKCLFVHPNCKYDARCTKSDCPFTHVSRRGPAPAPKPAPPPQASNVCRFFPECKKVDCPFYHPKPCRFAAQCKRAGCTFFHPTTSLPPRHALKWSKTHSRYRVSH